VPQLAGRPLRSLQSGCSRHGPEGTPHIGRVELGAVSSGEHQLWSGGFTFGDLLPGDVYRRRSKSGSGSSPSKSASREDCFVRDELRDNAFTVVGIDPDVSGSRPLGDLTQRDLRPDPDQLIGHKHLHLISRTQIASSASLTARRSQSAFMAGDFDAGDNRGSSSRGSNGGGAPFCAEQQQQRREHDQGVDGHEPTEQP
jgi:hypothetical protein